MGWTSVPVSYNHGLLIVERLVSMSSFVSSIFFLLPQSAKSIGGKLKTVLGNLIHQKHIVGLDAPTEETLDFTAQMPLARVGLSEKERKRMRGNERERLTRTHRLTKIFGERLC